MPLGASEVVEVPFQTDLDKPEKVSPQEPREVQQDQEPGAAFGLGQSQT